MISLTFEQQEVVAEQAAVEFQALQHVKQALRVALGWPTSHDNAARKLESVRFMAQSLERHLERLMRLEEEGGYMASIIDAKPHCVERVAVLRREHDVFRALLPEIMQRLKEAAISGEADVESCCAALQDLLGRLDAHDRCEQRLWQDGLLRDEGGEGG